jgi:nucleotide-binding universal stress UspA family protein
MYSREKLSTKSTDSQIIQLSRILVPIDGSTNSTRALNVACNLAKFSGAELVILNVIPTPGILVEAPVGFARARAGPFSNFNLAKISKT